MIFVLVPPLVLRCSSGPSDGAAPNRGSFAVPAAVARGAARAAAQEHCETSVRGQASLLPAALPFLAAAVAQRPGRTGTALLINDGHGKAQLTMTATPRHLRHVK